MKNCHKSNDVGRIVAAIDETRVAEHFRNPDRPNTKFAKQRRRQDPAIRRAKARLRTASYRNRLDQRGAPSTTTIGMALVAALVTVDLSNASFDDRTVIGRALCDLQERGFNLFEVRDTLKRSRRRVVYQIMDMDNPVVSI